MDGATRDRLLSRGIDAEESTNAFLEAIRSDFPLDLLFRNMTSGVMRPRPILPGLPLAMVLSESQRARFFTKRENRYGWGDRAA